MKIAFASLVNRKVEENARGGTEALTYSLIEGLVKKGHEVSLYASSDSRTSAINKGVVVSSIAASEALNEKLVHPYRILAARNLALDSDEYDIVHDSFFNTYLVSSFAPFIRKPLVHTIHNLYFTNPKFTELMKNIGFQENQNFVFISNHSMKYAEGIPNIHKIYNGINPDLYKYKEVASDYLYWVSRLIPDKGSKEAVDAVAVTDKKLVLQSEIRGDQDQEYFEKYILGGLGLNIKFLEESSLEIKIDNYQKAKAFLFPIQWEEPFGLVIVEAMSCGAPVIAYARGATKEIIEDGKTGFLINPSDEDIRGNFLVKKTGQAGIVEAIDRLYSLSESEYRQMRQNSRKRVEDKFTVKRMVDEYEKLYLHIISKS